MDLFRFISYLQTQCPVQSYQPSMILKSVQLNNDSRGIKQTNQPTKLTTATTAKKKKNQTHPVNQRKNPLKTKN